MKFLDRIPWFPLLLVTIVMAVVGRNDAGEFESHLLQKLNVLAAGTLTRPLDIFDLFLHGTPAVLLVLKGVREATR